jgi:glycosyltransferase involved in cell wall biosynthesis
MRICMVSDEEIVGNSAIIPRGIGQYILRYSEMLAEKGHDVTILCKSKRAFDILNGKMRWVGLPQKKISWDVTVFFWLRRQQFDIVEFPEWGGHGAVSAIFLKKKAGNIITRGHGHSLWAKRVHGESENKGRQHYKEWLQVHFSHGVLTNSQFLKEELIKDFGLKSSKIDVCHIGINSGAIGNIESVSNPYKGSTLIYVGALDHRKGTVDLIHLLSDMNKKQSKQNIKLILIGQDTQTGPNNSSYRDYCLETAQNLGVDSQIEFVPATKRTDLHHFYKRASVFVSTTRAETLGIPFLEAMSMGLPVVTWKTGAAPELINHGKNGLLYELDDKEGFVNGVLSILNDSELWNRLSLDAMENVQNRFLENNILDQQILWYQKKSI